MKVAIAGFGQEGKASYAYWNTYGNQVTIVDERSTLDDMPGRVPTQLGSSAFDHLDQFDIVVRSAGLAPHKLSSAKRIWSATNEFFAQCPAPIIGVTGTKGKGTTSSLITSILQAAGKRIHLVGNIGVPALAELPTIQPTDIVVFELSSFQLWDIEKSPHVAVVLGIEPDHLDVHKDLDEYIGAKSNITKHQSAADTIVYKTTNDISRGIGEAANSVKVGYPSKDGAHVVDGWFYYQTTKLCPVSVLQIPGAHNVENACAAIAAVWGYTQDPTVIEAGLRAFTGLPHRIKFVREIGGVYFYDDSYSSAPAAAIAAINSFSNPEIIILGGYDKGADFTELAEHIAKSSQVKHLLLMGQTRTRIAESLQAAGVDSSKFELLDTTDFALIVSRAYSLAVTGDVVMLSPACASFDMFKNLVARGEEFTTIVEAL